MANLYLLFWLSLIPFVTTWMGQNNFAALPVSLYGFVLLMSGTAYYMLERALIRYHGNDSALALALGTDTKGIISLIIYTGAIPLAFVNPRFSCAAFLTVAIMWFIPDRRIEKILRL